MLLYLVLFCEFWETDQWLPDSQPCCNLFINKCLPRFSITHCSFLARWFIFLLINRNKVVLSIFLSCSCLPLHHRLIVLALLLLFLLFSWRLSELTARIRAILFWNFILWSHVTLKITNKILAQATSTIKINWEITRTLYRVFLLKSLAPVWISHLYSANIN